MGAKNISADKERYNEDQRKIEEEKEALPYGGKVYSIYTSSAKEAKFLKSEDPELPFKAMGTFWAILLGLAMIMTSVLMLTHHTYSPSQWPPNLMIEGSKF